VEATPSPEILGQTDSVGPILSAEYPLPLLAKTDPPCSAVSLR